MAAATQSHNPFIHGSATYSFARERKYSTTNDTNDNSNGTMDSKTDNAGTSSTLAASPTGRRYSGETGDEWDASKTPPSRFQQRKGSIYATPNSRDGHVDRNHDRDSKYHEKLAEKGWGSLRRSSKSSN